MALGHALSASTSALWARSGGSNDDELNNSA